MQTHQKIGCIRRDLFQKAEFMLLLIWEQDTIPSLLVSQVSHWGNQWGLWETVRLQFPSQAAGVVEAMLTLMGQKSSLGGRGASTWGALGTSH